MGALALALLISGVSGVATHDDASKQKVSAGAVDQSQAPGLGAVPGAVTSETTAPSTGGSASSGGEGRARARPPARPAPRSADAPRAPIIPGTAAAPPCTAQDVKGTGITKTEITIGQIVSDVSVLPAQLKPNYEGLQAYVNLVNAAGGVCGRKIKLVYSNDNSNPAQHDYESMSHQVFAFVANSSLIDTLDYDGNAPFNPKYQDNGEYVPDVGGLAYSYSRNQSPMFAGVLGSLSPSLNGGAIFKYLTDGAKARGAPCRKAGIVYLNEPTGASEDSARSGGVAMGASWGGNVGAGNVNYYVANLADPEPIYEQLAVRMVTDGVNCAFTYMDLGSNVNLVKAMGARAYWQPDKCVIATRCFSVVSMPFSGYDPKFIRDAGDSSRLVSTFLPHIPLNETSSAAMQTYLKALKGVQGAEPSTFSLVGFNSGEMFVEALQSCGAAPTRACVMTFLRKLKGFTAGGLQSPVTPFRSTKVRCAGDCGSFMPQGVFDFKWIFNCNVAMQVQDKPGKPRDFYRVDPAQGYTCEDLRVVRGTAA